MKCSSTECKNEATHKILWVDGYHKYCLRCAMGMANVGAAIGYPVGHTLQVLTLNELLADDESEAQDNK